MGKAYDKLWEDLGVHVGAELSDEEIVAACKAYFAEHGKWPTNKAGDASRYFGFPITWMAVDQRIRSLYQFLIKQSLKAPPKELSNVDVLTACLTYKEAVGRWPIKTDGDASEYFGFQIDWSGISARIGSLAEFLVKQGLTAKRDITEEAILEACKAYFTEKGKYPAQGAGDASKWVGFPIAWAGIDQRVGGISNLLIKHGLTKAVNLTTENILKACQDFRSATGKWPTAHSGDASKYFGFPITWKGINNQTQSLHMFLIQQGMQKGHQRVNNAKILLACQKYCTENGTCPTSKSGDASKYFGIPITWNSVNKRVGSLSKFLVDSKIKESRETTAKEILEACKAYFAEHGRPPSQNSGDASKYFGFAITWCGINDRVESLSQFLILHELKDPPKELTEEAILKACHEFSIQNGKCPTAGSGDASKYFGHLITWGGIEKRVGSLSKFLIKHGLK